MYLSLLRVVAAAVFSTLDFAATGFFSGWWLEISRSPRWVSPVSSAKSEDALSRKDSNSRYFSVYPCEPSWFSMAGERRGLKWAKKLSLVLFQSEQDRSICIDLKNNVLKGTFGAACSHRS